MKLKRRYFLGLFIFLFCRFAIFPTAAQENPFPNNIQQIAWSADGSRFGVVTQAGLTIYDQSFNVIVTQPFPNELTFVIPNIAFSPDGERLYVGRSKYDPRHTTNIDAICAAHWIAVVCADHIIVETDTLRLLVELPDRGYPSAQWSRDGEFIALQGGNSTRIYNTRDGRKLHKFSGWPWGLGPECGLDWSPDNRYFVCAVSERIYILDAVTGRITAYYRYKHASISILAWSPDGTRLALGSYIFEYDPNNPLGERHTRHEILIVDPINGEVITLLSDVPGFGFDLTWSPDGTQLVSNTWHQIFVWSVKSGALIDSYQLSSTYFIRSLEYSPFGGRLIIRFDDRAIPANIDPKFVPLSTFAQVELDGFVQFVAPDASPERLSSIFKRCVRNDEAVRQGIAMIDAQEYGQFTGWLEQQPSDLISPVCVQDLQVVAWTVWNEQLASVGLATP